MDDTYILTKNLYEIIKDLDPDIPYVLLERLLFLFGFSDSKPLRIEQKVMLLEKNGAIIHMSTPQGALECFSVEASSKILTGIFGIRCPRKLSTLIWMIYAGEATYNAPESTLRITTASHRTWMALPVRSTNGCQQRHHGDFLLSRLRGICTHTRGDSTTYIGR